MRPRPRRSTASPGGRRWYGAATLATAYAVSDEFHQTFVAGRSGSPIDVAIDLAGILVALALLARNPRLRARIVAPA